MWTPCHYSTPSRLLFLTNPLPTCHACCLNGSTCPLFHCVCFRVRVCLHKAHIIVLPHLSYLDFSLEFILFARSCCCAWLWDQLTVFSMFSAHVSSSSLPCLPSWARCMSLAHRFPSTFNFLGETLLLALHNGLYYVIVPYLRFILSDFWKK